MQSRVSYHIAFWLTYWMITGYIESMLAGSSLETTFLVRILTGYTVELLVLPVKIGITYWFLYRLIPQVVYEKNYRTAFLEATLLIFTGVLIFRLIIIYIIYPYIYHLPFEAGSWLTTSSRLLWTFLDLFSVVGMACAIKLVKMRIQALQREKSLIEEKLQSELRFLRAQTNPHFLFNTLNNIYGLARKQSKDTAEVIMQLSKLLRYMLYECSEPKVPVGKELKVIQDYLSLERLRYGDRLTIDFEEHIDDAQASIAPLLLLPLVENAFTHGLSETRFDSRIAIRFLLKSNLLTFYITNTYDPEEATEKRGIGLKNVNRQLELLYPEQYELIVEAGETEFSTFLKINLNGKDKLSDR